MYDEHGSYGSAAAHPGLIGRGARVDPYPQASEESLGGYETILPLGPAALDESWDPAVELQQLLQTTEGHQFGTSPSDDFDAFAPFAPFDDSDVAETDDDALTRLNRTTIELPVARPASRGHRRQASVRKSRFTLIQATNICLAALGAIIVSMVSVFGGMVALDPLRHIAAPHIAEGLVSWWPLLVYGPWLVASLSILRASLYQRRVVHSWSVVLFFSSLTTLLCVAQAPRTVTDTAAAALPSLAALACFQQLVRQITLTRPPRQAAARHRTVSPPFARHSSQERPAKGPRPGTSPLPSVRPAQQKSVPVRNAFPRR